MQSRNLSQQSRQTTQALLFHAWLISFVTQVSFHVSSVQHTVPGRPNSTVHCCRLLTKVALTVGETGEYCNIFVSTQCFWRHNGKTEGASGKDGSELAGAEHADATGNGRMSWHPHSSGGHINPTVTFALCLLGREPWRKFPVYFLAQTLGAFLGSGIIFGMYIDAIWDFGQGSLIVVGDNATARIFATYPSKHLTLLNGFFDQIIGTAALIVCILAIVDPYNNPIPRGLEAFTVGFVVLVIGQSMGFNSGYAVNPARDLGPRIFTAIAGWGSEVFSANSYWSFVPIFAPFIGAVFGVMVYQLMVGWHVEGEERDKREAVEREQKDRLKLTAVSEKETA